MSGAPGVLIWIGQWFLLWGFGLTPLEGFGHDLSPISVVGYEPLSDDVHEVASAVTGLICVILDVADPRTSIGKSKFTKFGFMFFAKDIGVNDAAHQPEISEVLLDCTTITNRKCLSGEKGKPNFLIKRGLHVALFLLLKPHIGGSASGIRGFCRLFKSGGRNSKSRNLESGGQSIISQRESGHEAQAVSNIWFGCQRENWGIRQIYPDPRPLYQSERLTGNLACSLRRICGSFGLFSESVSSHSQGESLVGNVFRPVGLILGLDRQFVSVRTTLLNFLEGLVGSNGCAEGRLSCFLGSVSLSSGIERIKPSDEDQEDSARCLNPFWCFGELAAALVCAVACVGLFVFGGAATRLGWWWRTACWAGCMVCYVLCIRITHAALAYRCWFG